MNGRISIFDRMQEALGTANKIIWMHCSSLGEFEQGRPLLEKLKENYSSYKIILTFFSPSGYEVRKNYKQADFIFYLPIDSRKNAAMFFDIVKPQLIIFVKYEFWYFYLFEAKKRNIPTLLISAIFRQQQIFFTAYGHFYRRMLSCFTSLFVQNGESVNLLNSIGFTANVYLSGDTRFDRVVEIAESFEPISSIEEFCDNSNVIVAGSTWLEDDKALSPYANKSNSIKFIIAPHSISKRRLQECMALYKNAIPFSMLDHSKPLADFNTIIIDNIGVLSRLYKYATISYIGGGFTTDGVHNVLEAAVFSKPVVFGPNYKKFNEAIELVKTGGGISIKNEVALEAVFNQLLNKEEAYTSSAAASGNYVYSKRGTTKKILQFIYEKRLLTN